MMNQIKGAVFSSTPVLARTAIAGYIDNISLIARDTLPGSSGQPVPDEIVPTAEQVNLASSTFRLRPNDRRTRV